MEDEEWREYIDSNGDFCPDGVCEFCGIGNKVSRTYGFCKECDNKDVLGIYAAAEESYWESIDNTMPEFDEYNNY